MNLLLLLSALLSALTGGASAVRTPPAAHAVAQVAVAVQARALPGPIASRPQQAAPTLVAFAAPVIALAIVMPTVAEPLYASRRRE